MNSCYGKFRSMSLEVNEIPKELAVTSSCLTRRDAPKQMATLHISRCILTSELKKLEGRGGYRPPPPPGQTNYDS